MSRLGAIALASPYVPGADGLTTTDLDDLLRSLDVVPNQCTIYQAGNLGINTTYAISAAGGSRIALSFVLEGNDQPFSSGDLVVLQLSGMPAGQTYLPPAFTAFAITGVSSPVEVGATVADGSKTFTWSTSNSVNVQANSIKITDTTGSTLLASGLANTGSHAITLPGYTNDAPATQVWGIAGENTHMAAFSDTFSVAWEWRVYAGTSSNATLTANQIKALTDSDGLQAGFAGTYAYADVNGYKYFCYPDSMGSVAFFIDANTGFPVDMADSSDNPAYSHTANGWSYAIVSVTNVNSVSTNYRVYRTANTFSGPFDMRVS